MLWLSTPLEGAKIGHKEQNSSANDVQNANKGMQEEKEKRKEKEKKKNKEKKGKQENKRIIRGNGKIAIKTAFCKSMFSPHHQVRSHQV